MMSAPTAAGRTPARRHPGRTRSHLGLAGLAALAAATALVAACGSSSSSGSSSTGGSVVSVGTATVSGSSEQVLTNSSGYTLYYNTHDTSTSSSCTGTCASIWPPLVLSSGQPMASSSLPQALTAMSGANGRQVQYDGHPLYHYSLDTGPDQANGEGVDGIWFVATPSLGGAGASASASASPSAASMPYAY